MTSSIFTIGNDNSLVQLQRSDYASEGLLQRLLADHPSVLAATADDNRLLLIKREQEVPDAEDGGSRWSLDHLFVDHNAVPVLVEVKRATDTRIRREVVAQMLDYAANGISYWPLSKLIDAFERTCAARAQDPDAVLIDFIGDDRDAEAFWRQVEANLRSGRIRMIFVADRIPKELRRIVEFLNEQMRPAEVIAIEVEQYLADDGTRTLVPKPVGVTERAQIAKAVSEPVEQLTVEQWLDRLAVRNGTDSRAGADRAIGWFRDQGCYIGPTKSQDALSISINTGSGRAAWPFFIRSNGKLETSLKYLKFRPAFASDEARQALLERFKGLPGLRITTEKLTGWPAFPTAELLRDDLWTAFTDLSRHILSEAAKPA